MIATPAPSRDIPSQRCECMPDPIRVLHMAEEVRRIQAHIDQLEDQLAEHHNALEIAKENLTFIAANPRFGLEDCHYCRTSR